MSRFPLHAKPWARVISIGVWGVLSLLLAGCQFWNKTPQVCTTATCPLPEQPTSTGDYRLAFPDVVAVTVTGHPEWSGELMLNVDGQVTIGSAEPVKLDGLSANQAAQALANHLSVSSQHVHCQIVAYRSRTIHFIGQVNGGARSLPYQGPERLGEVIKRAGGLLESADGSAIKIIRRNTALGLPTQTFTIDYQAVQRGDARHNLVIEPNDEITVYESRRSMLSRSLPEWITSFLLE